MSPFKDLTHIRGETHMRRGIQMHMSLFRALTTWTSSDHFTLKHPPALQQLCFYATACEKDWRRFKKSWGRSQDIVPDQQKTALTTKPSNFPQLSQPLWLQVLVSADRSVSFKNKTIGQLFFFSQSQQKQVFLKTAEWRQCSIKANLCILRTSFG